MFKVRGPFFVISKRSFFSALAVLLWFGFLSLAVSQQDIGRIHAQADALKRLCPQISSAPSPVVRNDNDYARVATKSEMMAQHCFLFLECLRRIEQVCMPSAGYAVSGLDNGRLAADIVAECRQLTRFLALDDIEVDWRAVEDLLARIPTRYCFPGLLFRNRIDAIISSLNALDVEIGQITDNTRTYRLIEVSDLPLDLDGGASWPTGVYKFAENVNYSAATNPAITISADHMVLDLAGHTLGAVGPPANVSAIVVGADYVTVKNGSIVDFDGGAVGVSLVEYPLLQNLLGINDYTGIGFAGVLGGIAKNIVACRIGLTGLFAARANATPDVNCRGTVFQGCVSFECGQAATGSKYSGMSFDIDDADANPRVASGIGRWNIACLNKDNGFTFLDRDAQIIVAQEWDVMYMGCISLANLAYGFVWQGNITYKAPAVNCYAAYNGSANYKTIWAWSGWPNVPGTLPYYMSSSPTTATFWENIGIPTIPFQP